MVVDLNLQLGTCIHKICTGSRQPNPTTDLGGAHQVLEISKELLEIDGIVVIDFFSGEGPERQTMLERMVPTHEPRGSNK